MLGQRRRRWPNIEPALNQWVMFTRELTRLAVRIIRLLHRLGHHVIHLVQMRPSHLRTRRVLWWYITQLTGLEKNKTTLKIFFKICVLTLFLLITPIVIVLNYFITMLNQLLRMKCMFEHQELQMIGLQLNKWVNSPIWSCGSRYWDTASSG